MPLTSQVGLLTVAIASPMLLPRSFQEALVPKMKNDCTSHCHGECSKGHEELEPCHGDVLP